MRLSDNEIGEQLRGLPGWSRNGEAIEKQLTFASFPDAIAFVTRLAFDAEAVDHHPDLAINYRRVTVGYSTHSEGGVTSKDIEAARHIEELARRWQK
ncbi:MAG: 4a-hydroxytetrahydrobiopterin dehydratase [Luteitalea sp.]|nr:4a-hydroxytetrahydrobiopterin dehydratase [Luteitalea sp.]